MNDRLSISSAVPADLAERMSDICDLKRVEPTEEDLEYAKSEIVSEIQHGKTIGGMDLEACLDCELNQTETGQAFIRELAQAIGNPYDSEDCAAGYRIRVSEFLDRVVAKHVPASAIEERAWANIEEAA